MTSITPGTSGSSSRGVTTTIGAAARNKSIRTIMSQRTDARQLGAYGDVHCRAAYRHEEWSISLLRYARDMLTSCRRVALPIDTKNGSAESKPPRRTMCGGVQTEFLDSCSNNAWESLIKDVRGSSSHSRPPSDAPRACSHMTMLPV
jgi:hypothetical protein